MPLREYVCASGHSHERLERQTVSRVGVCPTCDAPATQVVVNRIAIGGQPSASEFEMPHDQRDAHEQAMGWKQEYIAAVTEETGNGWTP